ncbi:MAG: ATP-binding cassette domain-containing protein [Rhodospirillaceae bacterium]
MSDTPGPQQDPPPLRVAGMTYRYAGAPPAKPPALSDVSFQVPAGRVTALLGPNGAGKSTLFGLASGLLPAPPSHLFGFGIDIAQDPRAVLARMGLVFQSSALDLDMSVEENLRYLGALHGLPPARVKAKITERLEALGVPETRKIPPRKLNGGHRRRVELARALLHDPDLLLLDEPTVGLDIPTRRKLVADLHALAREQNVAVLWATHLIDEIDPETDRVVILHHGAVMAEGDASAVLADTGAQDLGAAFASLTGDAVVPSGGLPA